MSVLAHKRHHSWEYAFLGLVTVPLVPAQSHHTMRRITVVHDRAHV
jgi:hypothetical protein